MTTPAPALELVTQQLDTPESAPVALPVLSVFRLNIVTTARESRFYFVAARNQCAATKYTALRDEVENILHVMLWDKPLPPDTEITFRTLLPCP